MIGIAGPITPHMLQEHLDEKSIAKLASINGIGGISVTLLVKSLLERGQSLVIFTLDQAVREEVVLTGSRVRICIGPYRLRHRARDFFAAERNYLLGAMRRERPAIINAHWTCEYALAALDSGIATIVTARDAPLTILRLNPTPYRLVRTVMSFMVARRTSMMTANSPYTSWYWRKRMFFRGPITVIPNGVPDSLFAFDPNRPRPKRPVTFGMILSTWGGPKNSKKGIEAFARLKKQCPDVRLCMFGIGYGPQQEACRWALRRGLAEGIEFVGPLSHDILMQRLAKDIDILVHPALEESFGIPLIEAMAMGIPVIGGQNSGAVPYVLDQGRAGLLVDVRSPRALAEAMLHLIDDPTERKQLSLAGYQYASKYFRMDNVIDQYLALYQQVLAQQ